jgi:Domain of Unknown Function with PDB structure (DUF3857)
MYKSLLLISILFFTLNVSAQHSKKRKKELSEKELKEEQLKSRKQLEKVFGKNDPDFELREVPAKWKNESAVIIAQKLLMNFRRINSQNIYQTEISRRMILLKDRSAVEQFSEFYYLKSNVVGIRIIKPDGREFEVDRSEAIEVDKSISNFSYSYFGRTYLKVAIPNLEPGDILDYFYAFKEFYSFDDEADIFNSKKNTKIFNPVYIFMHGNYPVIKQVIDLTIDISFYLNAKSINGAPLLNEVKRDNLSSKTTYYDNSNIHSYVMTDTMRERVPDLRWFYRSRVLPFIKFQVMFFQTESAAFYSPLLKWFVGGIPKDSFTIPEINELVDKLYSYNSASLETESILKYLKKNYKKTPFMKTALLSYYYLRFLLYTNKYIQNDDWSNIEWRDQYNWVFASNYIKIMYELYKQDSCEKSYFVPNNNGIYEDIIFISDFEAVVLIKDENENKFLRILSPYTNFGSIHFSMEGIPVMSTNRNQLKKAYTIPVSSADDNKSTTTLHVKINDDMEGIKINSNKTLTGQNRIYDWSDVITPLDMINQDIKYLGLELPENRTKNIVKKKQILDERNRNMEEFLKNQSEKRKTSLESEYDITIDEYLGIDLKQSGRYHDKPELIYSESFTTNDFIQKAGRNYILNAGMLIGSQVEIGDDEKEREYDIYMSNARSFENNIVIEIPAGYTVSGIEKLNMHVSNETGSFVSTAKMNGNNLEIQTKKTYKHNFEKAEDWPLMIEFLDAAYKFTQIKVVLKKSE